MGFAPAHACESAGVPTPPVVIHLAQDEAADALLSRSPLALLIGMLLNQRIPKERAFAGPYTLSVRLGHEPDAAEIATFDPASFAALFAQSPAIHRFPGSMAGRVQKLAQAVVDDYDGDAEAVWRDARSGAELLKRLEALPGFGKQTAQTSVGLFGKELGVRPDGWREAAGPCG